MFCQLRELRHKPGKWRRRRRAGDHRTLENTPGWPVARGSAAAHTALGRHHRGERGHWRTGHHLGRHAQGRARNRLCLHEHGGGNGRHSTGNPLVDIHPVGHVGRAGRVVGVVDHLRVNDRVAAVEVFEIGPADRVGRTVDLARGERKPGHTADIAAGRRNLQIVAAHESDHRWRIVGPLADRAGHPGPGALHVGPAAVVRNGKTPGRVVNPGPAPGVDPGPVAIPVRCPVGRHALRHPHVAVGRVAPPAAMGIQVLVTQHVGRDVTRGDRAVHLALAAGRPDFEGVGSCDRQRLVFAQACTVEAQCLPFVDAVRRTVACSVTTAAAHRDVGRVGPWIYRDVVFAWATHREGQVGRIDLDHLVGAKPAHPHQQAALCQLQLGHAVVQIDHRHTGVAIHAQGAAIGLDLDPRPVIGPQTVAVAQRAVDSGLAPVVLASRGETDRATDEGQACYAGRRVGPCRTAQAQQGGGRNPGGELSDKLVQVQVHGASLRMLCITRAARGVDFAG